MITPNNDIPLFVIIHFTNAIGDRLCCYSYMSFLTKVTTIVMGSHLSSLKRVEFMYLIFSNITKWRRVLYITLMCRLF